MFCFEEIVLDYTEERTGKLYNNCGRWSGGKFECASWYGGFDVEEEVGVHQDGYHTRVSSRCIVIVGMCLELAIVVGKHTGYRRLGGGGGGRVRFNDATVFNFSVFWVLGAKNHG